MFVNIYVMRALFSISLLSFQLLNSMLAVTLLFSLLNTDQSGEQWQPVAKVTGK